MWKLFNKDGAEKQVLTIQNVPVATSIAGLGVPSDGKFGMLRLPDHIDPATYGYETLGVVYDAVLNKWVSPEQPVWSSVNPVAGNYGSNYDGGAIWGSAGVPWRPFLAAGLIPQVRFVGMTMDASTSTNLFFYITQYHISNYIYSAAVPNDLASIANLDGNQRAQTTPAQWVGYRSMWQTCTIPGSPKDILLLAPQTSRATSRIAGTVYLRWVG